MIHILFPRNITQSGMFSRRNRVTGSEIVYFGHNVKVKVNVKLLLSVTNNSHRKGN